MRFLYLVRVSVVKVGQSSSFSSYSFVAAMIQFSFSNLTLHAATATMAKRVLNELASIEASFSVACQTARERTRGLPAVTTA